LLISTRLGISFPDHHHIGLSYLSSAPVSDCCSIGLIKEKQKPARLNIVGLDAGEWCRVTFVVTL
jgi:hypothetical protein